MRLLEGDDTGTHDGNFLLSSSFPANASCEAPCPGVSCFFPSFVHVGIKSRNLKIPFSALRMKMGE